MVCPDLVGRKRAGTATGVMNFFAYLFAGLGEPLVSSTLIMPGEERPLTQGWEIMERRDHQLDAVVDSGECGEVPTTVVDLSDGDAVIMRRGAGDPSRFE